jgi:hypothetical protein
MPPGKVTSRFQPYTVTCGQCAWQVTAIVSQEVMPIRLRKRHCHFRGRGSHLIAATYYRYLLSRCGRRLGWRLFACGLA